MAVKTDPQQGRITLRQVQALQADDGKDAYLWDGELKGFGVRCRAGGAKFYLVKYRHNGRVRWATIGRHGSPWTPETARRQATALMGEIAAGRDPAGERDASKRRPTVAALAEMFLAAHIAGKRKASTATHYRDILERIVSPVLGKHIAATVTRSDVARLHQGMGNAPYQANRTLAVLSVLFNWAERHGYRPDGSNPCRHIGKFPEHKRERFLSETELARLADSLKQAEASGAENPFVAAAVRLLLFTGARLNEILSLQWAHVDVERATLRLPDSKTGAKTIYLSAPALATLAAIARIEGNPFVICGGKAGAHLVNLEKPWRRIRARAGLPDVRLHDLRHSFASVAASGGLSLPMIGKLLGHTQPATTARYAHLAHDPARAANEAIGLRIAAAMDGNSAEIVSLRKGGL
ncbi:MAG: tyrosine-type recombinase/integrase [Alphaproteobacteria bacterium]